MFINIIDLGINSCGLPIKLPLTNLSFTYIKIAIMIFTPYFSHFTLSELEETYFIKVDLMEDTVDLVIKELVSSLLHIYVSVKCITNV